MLLILDSNEYIFALGPAREPQCETILKLILKNPDKFFLRISRSIIDEVRNKLTSQAFKEFILFINTVTNVDDDAEIPFELGAKYEAKGLKAADALIAAFVEWTGADLLVTENRHFLSRQSDLPFKVVDASHCLKLIKSSH